MFLQSKKISIVTLTILSVLYTFGTGTHAIAIYRDALEYGTNASMIGIGKIEGFTSHSGVLLENPSTLAKANNGLAAFYLSGIDSYSYMTGAASMRLTPQLTIGIGVAREGADGLDYTGEVDSRSVALSTFGYSNSAYVVGISAQMTEMIDVGLSYTYYEKMLSDVRGQGSAFGIGARFDLGDTDVITHIKNIGVNRVRYNEGDDEQLLPEYTVGLRQNLNIFGFYTDLFGQVKMAENLPTLKNGGIRLKPFGEMIFVNAGYQESRGLISQVTKGLTLGVDLEIQNIIFSYAYQNTDYLEKNQEHYFSLFFKLQD